MWEIGHDSGINYLNACKKFVNDDVSFSTFKQDRDYNVILEHLSYSEAFYYLNNILIEFKINKSMIEKFKENDKYGGAKTQIFDYYDEISPSTIRYIKTVSDIKKFFPELNPMNIVEIGGGYGGLAKTINCVYEYDSYLLIDQPEVNMLSKKYLKLFPELHNKIFHQDSDRVQSINKSDLLISNYAISELSFDEQMNYYEKIVKNCDYIYITYNTPHYVNFLKKISKDFNFKTESEAFGNNIIYGRRK